MSSTHDSSVFLQYTREDSKKFEKQRDLAACLEGGARGGAETANWEQIRQQIAVCPDLLPVTRRALCGA